MRRTGLWTHSDFIKLWAGQTISQVGSRVSREALPLTAVLVLGASPLEMGLLSAAPAATVLLFGLFAGVWADRLRRRPILIAADLGRMALLATVPLAAILHSLGIAHLYVIAAAMAFLTVLFDVAYQACLPSLVERENLLDGNSKLALTDSIAEIAGPGITGVLVTLLTAPIAILVDAVSFLCSAVSLALIRKPEEQPARKAEPHMGRAIAEGLRLSWHDPLLRAMAARTGSAMFFGGFFGGLYILFAIRELRLNAAMLGFIIAVGGVSSLFGALVAQRLVHRFGFGRTFIGSALLSAVATLAIPMAHGPVWLCALFLIAAQVGDFAWPIYNVNEATLRQAITPDHLQARVNSAAHLMLRGALPLGSLAGGVLAQAVGIRTTMVIASAGLLLSILFLILSPIRRLRTLPEG